MLVARKRVLKVMVRLENSTVQGDEHRNLCCRSIPLAPHLMRAGFLPFCDIPHQFTTGSPSSRRPYKLDPRYELYRTELAFARFETCIIWIPLSEEFKPS